MKLVGVDIIEEAQKRHADAAKRLSAWKAEVSSKTPARAGNTSERLQPGAALWRAMRDCARPGDQVRACVGKLK